MYKYRESSLSAPNCSKIFQNLHYLRTYTINTTSLSADFLKKPALSKEFPKIRTKLGAIWNLKKPH